MGKITENKQFKKHTINHNIRVILLTLISVVVLSKVLLLFTEERNLFHPDKETSLSPLHIGVEYEDLYFQTEDNETINGWLIPAKGAKITILFCQGNSGNLSDQLRRVKFFHDAGVNLFIFDYRGFGNSSGKPNEIGLYKDARGAYDFLITRKGIEKTKIAVYGKSLGAPIAADLCLHRKLAALILEASFPSLKTYVSDMCTFLPTEWLVSEKFDTLSKVQKIHIPKLFLHGMDDEIIPFPEGRLLYNKAALPKEFVSYPGSHDDDMFVTSDAYRDRLNKFFIDNNITAQ